MCDGEHAGVVDGADRALALDVEEPVLDRRTTAEPDVARGGVTARPVHDPAARCERVGVHEFAHRVVESGTEPSLVVGRERHLVRRARDLGANDERVLRIDDRPLGRAPRQLARVRGVPLVELVVARDEDRGGTPTGATGTSGLLPHRRERAGKSVEHDRVETADVDAELERVGRRDAEQASAREIDLERAPLLGEIAGPIRGDAIREVGCDRGQAAARVLRDDLGPPPAPREREGLMTRTHEAGHELGGLDVRRRPRARVRVEERALPAREHPFGAW